MPKKLAVLSITILSMVGQSYALGSAAFSNQSGLSTRVMSMGYTFAGAADDPSAIFFNPGGLTQVKGFQLEYGLETLRLDGFHKTTAGVKDELAKNTPVIPHFYASYSGEDSRWAYGLGIESPFGLMTEWKDDSFSEFYATESRLFMYTINPTVAYQVSDTFSVGGGIDYNNIFNLELNANVESSLGSGVQIGNSKIEGDGTGWGYNLGFLWRPVEKHSMGVSYRSQSNVIIDGDASIIGALSFKTSVKSEVKLPQTVLLGYAYRPSDRFRVQVDYEWADWKSTTQTPFNYQSNPLGLPVKVQRDWKSTSNIGAGIEYGAKDWLDLRFGMLAYERVVPRERVESSLPDTSRWGITTGAGFHFGNSRLDVGYNFIKLRSYSVSNTQGNGQNLNGEYGADLHVVSATLKHKWGGQ